MTAPRDALSRDRVLNAALSLADTHGLDAVSMRRLGSELGVEAMSLYRHVASKEALLDAMVDAIVLQWVAVFDEPQTDTHPPAAPDWRTRIAAIMHRAHDTLLAHPWAVELVSARPQVGDGRLRYAEAITAALMDAGFNPQLAHHGLHIVDGTIAGFSSQEVRRPTAEAMGDRVQSLYNGDLVDEFPSISVTIREHHDHSEEYALMVDLVIEGLARLLVGQLPARHRAGAPYVISMA